MRIDERTAIASLKLKYAKYIENIYWHIRTNKPPEEDVKNFNKEIEIYQGIIKDLNGLLDK